MTLCYLTNKYEEDATLQEKVIEIEKKKLDLHTANHGLYVQTQAATQQQIAQTLCFLQYFFTVFFTRP